MNKIKVYREAAKLTQRELGRMIGSTQAAIGNYEKGIRAPDINVCKRIITALRESDSEVTLDKVFHCEEEAV